MEDKQSAKKSKEVNIAKMIVAILAVVFGVVGVATHLSLIGPISFGLIISLIAILIAIVVIVKKLDGKILAIIGLLLGLFGIVLGGIVTVNALIATFDLGEQTYFSYECNGDENCIEIQTDSQEDAAKIEEAGEKLRACIEEKGIDFDMNYDDLADTEKDSYDECVRANL